MKKLPLLTCFAAVALFTPHSHAATSGMNGTNAPAVLASNLPNGNGAAEMEPIGSTTAYYFSGVAWTPCSARIFRDTDTGDSWIKITHNGPKRGKVVPNPDYSPRNMTGALNRRLSSKYMTTADNGMTYYFN